MEVYTETPTEQAEKTQQADIPLSRADRRIILGASLRALAHRFSCGQPIFHDDVARVATFADDVEPAA